MAANQLNGPAADGVAQLLKHLLVPLSAHDYTLCRHLTPADLIGKSPNAYIIQDANTSMENQDPALRHTGSNAISIQEWEADTAAALAQIGARKAAKHTKQATPARSQQQRAQPVPVPLGANSPATDPGYVAKVNHLCQALALEYPVYDIRSTYGVRFYPTASVAGQNFGDDSVTFPNKKDAKAYIAKQMAEYLENSNITKPPPAPKHVAEENYVGMLIEYANATSTAHVQYEIFQLGLRFSCEATSASYPNEIFGNRNDPFSSKKDAKTNAAKHAVEYLRAHGLLGDKVPTKKQVKATSAAIAASTASSIPGSSPSSPGGGDPMSDASDRPASPNFAERIHKLARELGITGNLAYEFSQTDAKNSPAFYNCTVSYPHDQKLPQPIHETRNVYGKKNAKDECSQVVFEFLEELRAQRMKRKDDMLKQLGL